MIIHILILYFIFYNFLSLLELLLLLLLLESALLCLLLLKLLLVRNGSYITVSFLLQLFEGNGSNFIRRIILRGRIYFIVEINSGIVIQLSQPTAAFSGQLITRLVKKTEIIGRDPEPAHKIGPHRKRERFAVVLRGGIICNHNARLHVLQDRIAEYHLVALRHQEQRGHAVDLRRQNHFVPIFKHNVPVIRHLYSLINA